MKTLSIILLSQGKVKAHLEKHSIDLVFYCYFNMHHWKVNFLNGTRREEVTLGIISLSQGGMSPHFEEHPIDGQIILF
jgi:hypothetical protein